MRAMIINFEIFHFDLVLNSTSCINLIQYFMSSVPIRLFLFRYVKREIRSLTVGDREKFLDAAYAIWNYNQKDGVSKYGPKFTSIGEW